MKKFTKLLCILLVYALLAGSLAIGASAYADYTAPAGYNSLGKPRYSYEQACSMLLDYLDATLYKANINTVVDAKVTKLTINLTSIDNTFKSLTDILNNGWLGFASFIGAVGDVKDLNGDAIETPRRTNTTDSEVFYALLKFLSDNRTPVANVVNGSFNWGLIDNFLTDAPYLYDTPNFIKEKLYVAIYNGVLKGDGEESIDALPAGVTLDSFTIDGLLQQVVDKLLVGDYNVSTQTYSGFLPSMKGKTSITNGSTYELVQNAIDAAMNDIALPALMKLLPGTLKIEVSEEWPNGNPAEPGMLPTIIGIVNDYLHLGYDYDTEEYPVIELEKVLKWLLVGSTTTDEDGATVNNGAAIYNIISFTDHGIDINDELLANIKSLLRSLGPGLLQQFLPEYFPEDMVFPDMTDYNTDQFISYIFKLIAPIYLPNVRVLPNCDTVQECLTYTLMSFVIDILPENDYYGQIADGTLNPEDGAWVEVGTDYLIYFLNSIIDISIPSDCNFEQMLSKLIDWLIANYGFLFNTRLDYSKMNCWEKIDNTIFAIADSSWLSINVEEGKSVSQTMFMDNIIDGVQTLDLEKLFGFIGINKSEGAEFNKPVVEFVIGLISRVLKNLMNGNDIIPSVTRLETLVVGNSGQYLGETISNLFYYLYSEKDYNFPTIIPLVGTIIGLSQNDNFIVNAPVGYPNKSMSDLKTLMETYMPNNEGIAYDEDGYTTMGEEDYKYLYEYTDFEDTYNDCTALFDEYYKNPYAVTALDIKNLYYRLEYYYNQLTARDNLCKIQLMRELEYAQNNVPETNFEEDGTTQIYTSRSWRLYQEAVTFANQVNASDTVIQSTISSARQQLFRAIANLKDFKRLARYTVLDAKIAQAQKIDPNDYKLYTTNTITEFKDALKYAIELDRDYDVDDQSIVDAATTRLSLALNNLQLWELNYELGADIVIDSVVAKDSNTVLKFRESSGAAVINVSATVNNGATIGNMYTEGDYSCWVISPGTAPLYSVITATINFTQPSTGKTYTAYAYTFVSSGTYQIDIDVNTCNTGLVRNAYNVALYGINNASTTGISYHVDHATAGSAGNMSTIPTGMVYVDISQYTDLSEIPGLMFAISKDAATYASSYSFNSVFTAVNVSEITSSVEGITIDPANYSFKLNQTDAKNFTFSGAVPAAGSSVTALITATVEATATNGGSTISYPQFNLRVSAYDKSILRANVNDAVKSCRQEWFYSGGWDIYKRDLENAVKVLNNPIVTQAQIDEANENLLEAISWLEYKSADYREFHKVYSIAQSLNPFDYQDFSSVTRIMESIDYNKGMLEQSLVDETVTSLKEAIKNLKPAQGKITIHCYDVSGAEITSQSETEVETNSGSAILLNTDSIVGDIGEKVIINVPQMMGYTSTDSAKLVTITRDGVVVSFNYTPDTYRVIFNANGGSVDTPTKYVTYGKTYSDLPVPTRTNYVFTGWYTKLSGGMAVNDTTKVTTSYYRTLYAHWEENPDAQSSDISTESTFEEIVKSASANTFLQKVIAVISQLVGFLFSNVLGIK